MTYNACNKPVFIRTINETVSLMMASGCAVQTKMHKSILNHSHLRIWVDSGFLLLRLQARCNLDSKNWI